MKNTILLLSFIFLSVLSAKSQIDGAVDENFKSGWYANAKIEDAIVQDDGKIVLAGSFDVFDNQYAHHITRINPDLTIDTSFHSGDAFEIMGNYSVKDLALLPDGKILVAGLFHEYDGDDVESLIRLNTDGTLDPTFYNNHDITGTIYESLRIASIDVNSDGLIVASGGFTGVDGIDYNNIVMFNPDGTLYDEFNCGDGFEPTVPGHATVYKVKFINDSTIAAAGTFNYYNNVVCKDIAKIRIDGSRDISMNPDGLPSSSEYFDDFYVYPDSSMILSGSFNDYPNDYDDWYIPGFIKVKKDGSYDPDFNGFSLTTSVSNILTVQDDGTILVCNGKKIFRVSADGVVGAELDSIDNGIVKEICPLDDDRYLAYGSFLQINKVVRNEFAVVDQHFNLLDDVPESLIYGSGLLAEYDSLTMLSYGMCPTSDCSSTALLMRIFRSNGSVDETFNTAMVDSVYKIAVLPDGKIIVAGSFTNYNDTAANQIIRLLPNGNIDETFITSGPYIEGLIPIIYDVLPVYDGKIVVGGYFDEFAGHPVPDILRLNEDGSYDPTFYTGIDADGSIRTLAKQSSGKILAGGTFSYIDGDDNMEYLTRLYDNGDIDYTFNGGVSGVYSYDGIPSVQKINVLPDDRIYIGGNITSYDGYTRYTVARLQVNGLIDLGFDPDEEFFYGMTANPFFDLAAQPDGKVIVSGGVDVDWWIKRLKIDGSLDNTFYNSRGKQVKIICTEDDGIYVTGNFSLYENVRTSYLNVTRNGVAKLKKADVYCYSTLTGYICGADPYVLPSGILIYDAGIYSDTADMAECKMVTTATVYEAMEYAVLIDTSLCDGETYVTGEGDSFDEPGTYIENLESEISGCDSVVTINLLFNPVYEFTDSVSIADGGSYILPDGTVATEPGTYISSLETTQGCDSIITTYIDILTAISHYSENKQDFQIYPNPSAGQFTVMLNDPLISKGEICIFGINGQLVWKKDILPENGLMIPMDLKLSSGIYSLRITTDELKFSEMIVINSSGK